MCLGEVRLTEKNGALVLEFLEDVDVQGGPSLYMFLAKSDDLKKAPTLKEQ